MKKLGEQWIEIIDGQEHMVKAVKGVCENCGVSHLCNLSADCPMDWGLIAKDLGILNKDGCLPAPWNKELYPDFYNASKTLWCIHAESDDNDLEMKAAGNSRQQAIDAWNRRS